MNRLAFLLLITISFGIDAQQTIRGKVIDKQSKTPLLGAGIALNGSSSRIGTLTDEDGNFLLENIPLGRNQLLVTYIGYEPLITESFLVTSAKEPFLEIGLIAGSIATEEVVVTASKNAFEPTNELSGVSTRSFTVEETERIPAGVNDPGRVALSYPGVQVGSG